MTVCSMKELKPSLYKTLLRTIRRRCVRHEVYCLVCKENRQVLVNHSNEKFPKKIEFLCGVCGCKGIVTLKKPNRFAMQRTIFGLAFNEVPIE